MRAARTILAAVAAAVAMHATAADEPFVADGEVSYQRGSAAYDAGHVRGPRVNMALTKDGRWGGSILGKDVILTATPERISGAGVNLVVKRDAKELSVEGLVSGVRVRVKATRDVFVARVGNTQVECNRSPDGIWFIAGGSDRISAIRFKASANKIPDVPMPQWILAVIGAL